MLNKKEIVSKFRDTKMMTLGEIVRYNDRQKITKETVAEHIFYVAANVIRLCDILRVGYEIKCAALEMAISHDIPEIFTGDIGYITKRDNPELAKALEKTELEQLKKNMPEFYESFKDYTEGLKNREIPSLIVKIADVLSVLQYSDYEIELGNWSSSMETINEDALSRVLSLLDELSLKI